MNIEDLLKFKGCCRANFKDKLLILWNLYAHVETVSVYISQCISIAAAE